MFARANFDQFASADLAVSRARLLRAIARLPRQQLHLLISTLVRGETWLRWPLRTLRLLDGVEDTFQRIDPEGQRLGLTPTVKRRFRNNLLYGGVADLAVILSGIDKPGFRKTALTVEGQEVLDRERQGGPGAIVIGFRLGVYPVIPMALGALGYDVSMIVGGQRLVRAAEGLGREFAPTANARIRYIRAQESLVLARALEDLNAGRVVCTLMELSPIRYAKTTAVRFLDWTINVPYGIPYLSAMTQRPIIPALLLSEKGPRYRLRFLEPMPPPDRGRASILAAAQELYGVLEAQVLQHPDQWVGWTILESHLGIDLGRPVPFHVPAVS